MSLIIGAFLTAGSGVLAVLAGIFSAEVLAAIFCRRDGHRLGDVDRGSVAVVVPAHNEAALLPATLENLMPQLAAFDRLLVVADNCTDATVAIARSAGAEVLERFDGERVGKGYALEAGIRHLAVEAPDVVIFIDADCRAGSNTLHVLATACLAAGRPVQALNLMIAPRDQSVDHRVAVFAWRVKNWVRPLGLKALGLPCQLMGTGMAFPWPLIQAADLGRGHIVEDLKLGMDCARAGHPALFWPSAIVTSEFPTSAEAAEIQRRRWEGGHLKMAAADAPKLLLEAIARRNASLLALVLDLAVPPLTLLGLSLCVMLVLAWLAFELGSTPIPLLISAGALGLFSIATALAWVKFGRDVLPLGSMAAAGPFLLRKLRLYRRIFGRRDKPQWIRTDRDPGGNDPGS